MEAIKEHLHKLIDKSQDTDLLMAFTEILEQNQTDKAIWTSLSESQKTKVLLAESEIDYPEKQISHDEMLRRNKKWLK